MLNNPRFDKIIVMNEFVNEYQKIKVSKEAYLKLKAMARQDKYRGRGLIGAFDDVMLGRFTTSGSGRVENFKKSAKNVAK